MTDDELKALVAGLAIAQKATDEKLERIGINLGNISKNQGDVAEELFFKA
ncbi:MAG: hypothetical protein WCP96_11600 [Methylococcaceae bacterium]